jgi:excisionase family DNA binding protein
MSVQEAARYIGVTETALRRRVERGSIPFIRDGRNIRFDAADLDRFMAAHKVRRKEAAGYGEQT